MVFGVGSVLTYNLVQNEVKQETGYSLVESYRQIANSLSSGVEAEALENDNVKIELLPYSESIDTQFIFSDTIAPHPNPNIKSMESYRMLNVTRKIEGKIYKVEMMNIFIESDDIEEVVWSIMTRLFLILGGTLILFSFLISRWLFHPFQKTLASLKKFNVKNNQPLELSATNTTEFKQLNQFLSNMTDKVRADYVSLKEFSENASHEMQTPIAIAKGKMELLLNSPELQAGQVELVQSAQTALSKLSKLGKGLALISKIENQEFSTQQPIDFSIQLKESIALYKDLAELKNINIQTEIANTVKVKIDPNLADILIANLLKNAIQHNDQNGWVKVELTRKKLEVSNSGSAPKFDTITFFERFRKNNQSSGSLGLGLSIVKKICEVNSLTISYNYKDKAHVISVVF